MKTILLPTVLVLCFVLAACSTITGVNEPGEEVVPLPGSSPFDEFSIEGTPNQRLFSVEGGYFIWKNGNSFSVRIANHAGTPVPIPAPFFVGKIQVERGTMQRVRRHNIGSPDDIEGRASSLDFRIELKPTVSGFDFEIQPMGTEYCVLFDLRYGPGMPGIVHLGRSMKIPENLPLNICFR